MKKKTKSIKKTSTKKVVSKIPEVKIELISKAPQTISSSIKVKKESKVKAVFNKVVTKVSNKLKEQKQKREIKNKEKNAQVILKKISDIEKKYHSEYRELAVESEKLHDAKLRLEEKYKLLEKKTGLAKLYTELTNLREILKNS